MQKRKLGKSGLEIAPLVLGGNVFGWTVDQAASFELLDGFVAAGGNCIDTADMYSRWIAGHQGGESETIIGNWLKSRGGRERVLIATKLGQDMGGGRKGLARGYLIEAVAASLKRLQTDYIDLYQAHIDDESVPLEETLEAFSRLLEQGKVRAIGASNYSGARLAQALELSAQHHWPRYESLQPHYNLYDRADYERDLQPVCLRHEIGVIPYYGLAGGFLTGKYRSEADLGKSPRGWGIKRFLDPRGLHILTALDQVAAEYRVNPAQIALAWLVGRPSVTAPIASATNLDQLHDLIQGVQLKLDREAIERLDRASA